MPDWLYIILLIILVGLSALLTAVESAMAAISRIRVRYLVEQNVPGARALDSLLEHPSRLMTSIILLDNAANITSVSIATLLAVRYLDSFIVLASAGTMLFIVLIFGEIIPKTFGARHAESLSLRSAIALDIISRILSPIARVFTFIASVIIRLTGGRPIKELPVVSEEEAISMISAGEEEGMIEEEEKELIHSIFEFGDTVVREVMVPRMDMVAVSADAPIEEVLSLIIREGHSRIPVYEDTVDNVIGVIYAKDLLIQVQKGNIDVPPKKLMRPAYYVPELKKVDELLRELQKKRLHIAIVVDEYGGTAGLVTIEDLLEEIVGEIFDEYDLEETLIEYIDDRTIRMDARVNIDEANEILKANLSRDDIDTVGGFVYSLFGRIPNVGEEASFEGFTFKVEKIIGRRISKILITREETGEEESREVG
ncbi:MAG: HlyC/CorC family transporter [Actinobacteria bacterium]|nr:HlyC/CorC family transporter [Actinomycetota bacterium]